MTKAKFYFSEILNVSFTSDSFIAICENCVNIFLSISYFINVYQNEIWIETVKQIPIFINKIEQCLTDDVLLNFSQVCEVSFQ